MVAHNKSYRSFGRDDTHRADGVHRRLSAAQAGQLADILQRVINVGHFDAALASSAVALPEQQQLVEVR